LTTVIGIKCIDGIVLASDSQLSTNYIKNLHGSKIFPVNKFIALGSAGAVSQMRILVTELQRQMGDNIYDDVDLRFNIEEVLLALHKRYNIHWSASLERPTMIFTPSSILGAKLSDDSFGLYQFGFYQDGPWVEPLETYGTTGSGALFASLVIKQQSRAPAVDNKTLADLELGYNLWVASYVINEIKDFDNYSGGATKVTAIHANGFNELSDRKVLQFYNKAVSGFSIALKNSFGLKNRKNTIKRLFPRG
jgi:20S proteasome alpha/beta subunit